MAQTLPFLTFTCTLNIIIIFFFFTKMKYTHSTLHLISLSFCFQRFHRLMTNCAQSIKENLCSKKRNNYFFSYSIFDELQWLEYISTLAHRGQLKNIFSPFTVHTAHERLKRTLFLLRSQLCSNDRSRMATSRNRFQFLNIYFVLWIGNV